MGKTYAPIGFGRLSLGFQVTLHGKRNFMALQAAVDDSGNELQAVYFVLR
jgi:hypothetical protein